MKYIKRIFAAVLAAVLIFSLSACSDDGRGGVLRYPIDEEPVCLDPQIAQGTSAKTAVLNCFEGLVRFDGQGNIVPGVAENWSYDSSLNSYIFKLRQDTEWVIMESAFEPLLGENAAETFDARVTADDFVFALRRALSAQTGAPDAAGLYIIKNARAVHEGRLSPENLGASANGDFELRIELEDKNTSQQALLELLTQSICMPCNEDFFNATNGRYGLDYSTLMCNGPFYLSYWTREASLTLRANEGYRGYSPVAPASVTLFINNDNSDRLLKVLDGVYCASPLGETAAQGSGLTVTKSYDTVWSLSFNCSDSSLSNQELRRALCSAVNSSNIIPLGDDLRKTFSIIPPSCTVPGVDMSGEPVTILGQDSAAAFERFKRALEQLSQNAVTLDLICIREHETAMRRLIQDWQQAFGLGINISISVVDRSELDSRVAAGDYRIALAPVRAKVATAQGFLLSLTEQGDNNIFRFKSDDFDSAVESLQTLDSAQLLAACRRAESIFLVSAAALPLFSSPSYFAVAQGVEGLYFQPDGSAVSFIDVTKKD